MTCELSAIEIRSRERAMGVAAETIQREHPLVAALVEVCAVELLTAELWRQRAESRSMP
jgi:hypothetical protein